MSNKDKGHYVKKSDGKGGVNPKWEEIHGKVRDTRTQGEKNEARRISDNQFSGYEQFGSAVEDDD